MSNNNLRLVPAPNIDPVSTKTSKSGRTGIDQRGGGGDNNDMEARVKALEEAMILVRQDVAVMRSNYATKEDVMSAKADIANAKASIIMWVVGAIIFAQVLPALPGIFRSFGLLQ